VRLEEPERPAPPRLLDRRQLRVPRRAGHPFTAGVMLRTIATTAS